MDQVNPKIKWHLVGFAVWLSIALVLGPIREAKALLPAFAAIGMFARTPLGKSLFTSLAIHAGVLAVEFHNTASASPPATDADKRLEVKLNPKDPMKTPPGWTAGTAASPEPVPPSTSTGVSGGANTGGLTWAVTGTSVTLKSSPGAACSAANPTWYATQATWDSYDCHRADGSLPGYQAVPWNCTNGLSVINVGGYASCGPALVTCPVGYVQSGSSCTLSDATVVVKPADGVAEVKRVGNVLYADARDSEDGLPFGVVVQPDRVQVAGRNGESYETKINPDGTSTVTSMVPRSDGSAKTDKTVTSMSAPDATTGAVAVTGVSATTYTGTGTEIAGTPDPAGSGGTSDAKDSTLQAIKGSIDAGKAATDADRTAAETNAAGISGQLNALKATGQDTVGGLGMPTQSQFGVSDVAGIGNALPSNSGGCVALDVSLPQLGNLHIAPCAVVSAVGPLVDFLIIALGVAGGIFVLLGRREES